MSECKVELNCETIGKLNERNRRLCVVAREMYKSLLYAPSSWEDEDRNIKYYKDELKELGVL